MLISLKDILAIAEEKGCAIGSFNTPNLECINAVIAAAEELNVPLLGKMPIDTSLAQMVDNGEFERFENEYLAAAAKAIDEKLNK